MIHDALSDAGRRAIARERTPGWISFALFIAVALVAFFAGHLFTRTEASIDEGKDHNADLRADVKVLQSQKADSDRRFDEIREWMKQINKQLEELRKQRP